MEKTNTFNIPWGTIIRIALGIFLFYALYLIRGILLYFVFSVVIAVLFDPIIDFLQSKLRLSRTLATLFSYFSFLALIVLLFYYTIPLLLSEMKILSDNFSSYFSQLASFFQYIGINDFQSSNVPGSFQELLINISGNIIALLNDVLGVFISILTVLSLSIFISMDEEGVDRGVKLLLPKKSEEFLFSLWQESKKRVALWFEVRILTSLFISLAVFIFCNFFIKTQYSVLFSVLAGVLDLIPVIGPIIASIIISIFLWSSNINSALIFLVFFIILQQIESNIITPMLSKKLIGISPVLVLLAVLAGGKLWGPIGALLAIPLTGLLSELVKDFLRRKKEENYE